MDKLGIRQELDVRLPSLLLLFCLAWDAKE